MTLVLNGTTGVSSVDGSAATPAIQGADSNTGVFFPAADTVAIATGGSERLRADSSGNVGIGTSSPVAIATYPTLDIRGSTGGGLRYGTSTAHGYLYADSNGAQLGSATSHPLILYTNGSERARIDSSGNLLVGKTTSDNTTVGVSCSPAGSGIFVFAGGAGDGPQIQVVNTTASGTVPNGFRYLSFRLGATATEIGTITKASATTVAYNTSSDYRLKYDIAPMTGALEKVKQLKPCTYKWHEDDSNGEGFIAHELAEVCPFAVTGEKDAVNEDGSIKPQGIDTSFLVATLTAAIQEQQAMIVALKAEVDALKGAQA